ncbi:hypothetical protein DFQ11_10915 [Winogradskyella epiphytica]|uniref:Uncharacterized protein n=1 Tax=Winogradskyella epiphytica TaxID=262005 RepID=A0A2V4X4H7_9FLAO|nr:hypothetical protein DFQ11_10915 [Winogradskyella epiphytica]
MLSFNSLTNVDITDETTIIQFLECVIQFPTMYKLAYFKYGR